MVLSHGTGVRFPVPLPLIGRIILVALAAGVVARAAGAPPEPLSLERIRSAVHAYTRGDAAGVADARTWRMADVRVLAQRIIDDIDQQRVEATAMVVTEVAASFDSSDRAADYLNTAETIVRGVSLSPRAAARAAAFDEHWYAYAASLFLADTNPSGARPFIDRGLRLFPRSAPLSMLSGAASESAVYLLNPECTHPGCTLGGPRGVRLAAGRKAAEKAYRRALQSDPRSVEARLRLGHVLAFGRDHGEGRRLLASVVADDPAPTVAYLADIFLAEVDTMDERLDDAKHEYEQAIAARRDAQTPWFGLSIVNLLMGDAARSRDAVRQWMDAPHPEDKPDPWWLYQNGERDDQALDWLRQEVRR